MDDGQGIHLDPSIYLMEEEKRDRTDALNKNGESITSGTSDIDNSAPVEQVLESSSGNAKFQSTITRDESKKSYIEVEGVSDETSASQTLEDAKCPEQTCRAGDVSENQGEIPKDSDPHKISLVKKTSSTAEPIVIPIVLKMAEFDHKALLEEWISTRTFADKCLAQDQDKLIRNLKTIQDYLCSFEAQGLNIVNISATTFPQTLDRLHSYLLQCIEDGVSAASPKTGREF